MAKQKNCFFNLSKTFGVKRVLQFIAFSLATLVPAAQSIAEERPDLAKPKIVVPEKIAGVAIVTAKEIIGILTSKNPAIVIDARIEKDREFGYIESSISLPDIKTNCDTLEEITADKSQYLMVNCNGIQCGRSVVSIKVARSYGYTNRPGLKASLSNGKTKDTST